MTQTCKTCKYWFGNNPNPPVPMLEGYAHCMAVRYGAPAMTGVGMYPPLLYTQSYFGCNQWEQLTEDHK